MYYGEGVYGEGVYADIGEEDSHVGIGQIGIAGLSQIETNYRATGIGQIGINGQSLIETNYRTTGIGQIGITGQSLIEQSYKAVGIGQIGISGQSIISKSYEAHGIGQIGIIGQSLIEQNYRAIGIGQIGINGASLIESGITVISNNWISTHYRCVLTGAADAMEDLELPISSFQTRMGSDPYRVYLSIVVPNVDAYIDGINARPNGEIKITRIYNYLDGSSEQFVMAQSAFDTIQTNQGAKSGSTGNISGYKTLTAGTAHALVLTDPITRSSDNGRRRYRCQIDPRVRPLDTVTINGESFQVDQVIHIIDTKTAIMEIQELVA